MTEPPSNAVTVHGARRLTAPSGCRHLHPYEHPLLQNEEAVDGEREERRKMEQLAVQRWLRHGPSGDPSQS